MGLSSLPTPSDGVLTLVLVNTALSFSLLKQILWSFLHNIGFNLHYRFDSDLDELSGPSPAITADSISDRFKTQVKVIQFGRWASDCSEQVNLDCRVCLSRFEPESMVNRLPCGHLFHSVCLARWLEYHHVTCPLCRTRVLPDGCHDGGEASCPQF